MSKHITVTCKDNVHAALKKHMDAMKKNTAPGVKVSMSDYVSSAIHAQLVGDGMIIEPEKQREKPTEKVAEKTGGGSLSPGTD